jgi:hypothetical protein
MQQQGMADDKDPWAQFSPAAPAQAQSTPSDAWAAFSPTTPDALAAPNPIMTEQANLQKGVVRGMMDLPEGAAQLATHGIDDLAPSGVQDFAKAHGFSSSDVDQYIKTQEDSYKKNFPGGVEPSLDIGRAIGNMAAVAPVAYLMPGAAAEGLGARMASGFASGAANGAMQPVNPDDKDYWTQKAIQTGAGAAGGAGGTAAISGVARAISPNTDPNVKTLMDAGVRTTPGQIVGGWFKDLEDKFTSVPGLGDAIKSAQRRAVDDLNTAAVNRSLSHIGESLDSGTPVGRDAISQMHDKISSAYDTLLPKMTFQADPQFVQNVTGIRANANLLPDQQTKFDGLLKQQFSKIPNGVTSGNNYKEIESVIKKNASDYMNSGDPDQRHLGQALQQVQVEMRGALSRSNPQYAPELSNIDAAYADALRVQGAAGLQGANEGVFSPAQLSSSVRSLDPSLRKGSFARGEARMQDLSDAGKSVLGSNVPDSGTAGRGMAGAGLLALAGGGGEMMHLPPEAVIPTVAAGAAGLGAYTRPGQYLARAILARRPDFATPLASGVSATGPLGSSALANVIARQAVGQ